MPDASEDGIVSIRWYSEEPDIIDMDGKISAKVSSKGEKVKMIAVLTLNSAEVRESFELKVYPKKSEGNAKEDLENNLESVNAANETDEYYLPKEVNGKKVTWYQKSETSACAAAVVILFLGVYIVISKRKKEEKYAKERLDMLARDYPEIVSRIMLMVCSGCTIRQAFMRIAAAYCKDSSKQNRKKLRPAFEETVALCRELENGISETIAYDHMSRRCELPIYKTLAVLLTQSLQKGSTTIVSLLEQETMEALNEKKRRAKTATDAAALKLLLPLGMMLMVALALMLVPAMISF